MREENHSIVSVFSARLQPVMEKLSAHLQLLSFIACKNNVVHR